MPIPTIPKGLYPFVPKAPGVPPVLRSGLQILDTLTLGFLGLGELSNSLFGNGGANLWGVFDSKGDKIADYDSVVSVSYQDNSRVVDYPVEQGSFASYNKVDQPFTIELLLTCAGDYQRRDKFQQDLIRQKRSLNIFRVLGEDSTYTDCNLTSVDWQRTVENGANIIKAYCEFREIRQRGTTQFSQTEEPSGSLTEDIGQVQPVEDPTIDATGLA